MFFRNISILFFILILLPSCALRKYYKSSNMEFHQGKELPDEREALDGKIKTRALYDQFETKAIFDVIYQDNSVRKAYVERVCLRKGNNKETKEALLRKELEETKHWISFFVLADIRDEDNISLTDKNSNWSFYLKLENGKNITPISIKEVDLEPEYKAFFKHRFNSFKRSYELKFPATDLDSKHYLNKDDVFYLVMSSAYKKADIVWNKKSKAQLKAEKAGKKRKILKDEDFYWG